MSIGDVWISFYDKVKEVKASLKFQAGVIDKLYALNSL